MRKLEEQFKRALWKEEIEFAQVLQEGIAVACSGDNHQLREAMTVLPALIGVPEPPALQILDMYRKEIEPYEIYLEE